jgi:hypothetical protein
MNRFQRWFALPIPDIKRKHALAVIAQENGFASWNDLKNQITFVIGGFLNHWFSNYTDAKTYQQSQGGFLFAYKQQFFVCDDDYIRALGFDLQDPDWFLIDRDWVMPKDPKAGNRLYKKWLVLQEKK